VSNLKAVAERELFVICRAVGAEVAIVMTALADARKPFEARVESHLDLERDLLEEKVRNAFADVDRIEPHVPRVSAAQSSATSSSDACHRYGVVYLQVGAKLPQMTRHAVRFCHEALRRCVLVYVPRRENVDADAAPHSVQSAARPIVLRTGSALSSKSLAGVVHGTAPNGETAPAFNVDTGWAR
jgi:hypothetical protein